MANSSAHHEIAKRQISVVRSFAPALLLSLLLLLAVSWQSAVGQGVDSRLGFSHTAGQLPGLDDGYTRFNSFLPLIGPSDYSLVFADLGFVLYNENTQADGANIRAWVCGHSTR